MLKKNKTDGGEPQNLAADEPKKASIFARRSFRYGSMATVFTVVFIAIVVLINVLVSFLSDKYPMSIDLTSTQSYKLSAKSVKYVKSIKQKVNITVLADESSYLSSSTYAPCVKIMEQYPKYNSNISISFVNTTKNPSYASNYPKETLETADLIVSSGSKYKHISYNDLLQTSTDETTGESSVTGDQTEQQLDSALQYLTTTDLPTIMVTSGHSEVDSTGLQDLLKKNNYTVETKNIATDGVDKNATALVIVNPKTDFTTAEIKAIDDYLNNDGKMGKNLYVFYDPQQGSLPNLEAYTKEWGLQVEKGVIYDQTNAISIFQPIEGDVDSDTFSSLPSNMHADLAISRPLTVLFSSKSTRTTTTLVSTGSTSRLGLEGSVTNETAQNFQPSSSDKKGPFVVMAKSVMSGVSNNTSVKSTVVVSGSTSIVDSSLLSETNLTNADLILDLFNNVSGFKSSINITAKSRTSTSLNMTSGQITTLEILFFLILPLIVLAIGLTVWLRRRHL